MPDAGDVELPAAWTIAHVAQETPPVATRRRSTSCSTATASCARSSARSPRPRPRTTPTRTPAAKRSRELHHRFEAIGGYAARARAATLLAGLGFADARHGDPVASFSGGWRMRLNLAQALMCRSDLLLLDEPTNHLDLDAVLWLEDWLGRYPGTLLLITHDRDFLDGVVDDDRPRRRAASSRPTPATTRSSSASARAARAAAGDATRSSSGRSRTCRRSSTASAPRRPRRSRRRAASRRWSGWSASPPRTSTARSSSRFAPAGRRRAAARAASSTSTLGYGGRPPVLADLDWSILAGDRIGLLGPNGAGKSTLLKAIAGTLAPRAGERLHRAGRCASATSRSTRSSSCAPTSRRCGTCAQLDPAAREQELRDFLGGFDFRGDMASAPVGRFSGGEKARLTLALIVRQKPNLLLLDEPTNHLDIEMREALAEALQDYDGALVVVAHDRHLLRATTDALWLVADGTRRAVRRRPRRLPRLGARAAQPRRRRGAAPRRRRRPTATPDRKAQKRAEAEARQRATRSASRSPTRLGEVEREMAALARGEDGARGLARRARRRTPSEQRDELKAKLARAGRSRVAARAARDRVARAVGGARGASPAADQRARTAGREKR